MKKKIGYLLQYKRSDGEVVQTCSPLGLKAATSLAQAKANEIKWPVHIIAHPSGESVQMIEPTVPWVCMGVKQGARQ